MTSADTTTNNWEEKAVKILAILLGVFFLAKVVNLYTPLFHDELGVYGRALFYMLDNGSSMIPGDVDPELSRGHPLFFVFFVSLLTSWLGGTYVAARFVILLLSLALLLTTYFLGKEMFNKKVGLLAAIMLSFQPMFFAQSTLILPEVMLALLGMLSLLFYLQNRYVLYFIVASLLILTKETAIVVFAGIVLNEWYNDRFKITLALIGSAIKWSAPIACFVLFLVIQKQQHGWYLYPYHTGFISFGIADILERFSLGAIHLFTDQGRFMLLILVGIALKKMTKEERVAIFSQNFLPIAVCIMMFGFSSLNYFMARYQVLLFPLLMISILSILYNQGYNYKHFILYFVLTIPFQCNFFKFRTDDNMSYLITVENMKKSVAELDRITQGKAVKVFAIFPEVDALRDPRNGFTSNPNYILYTEFNDSCEYILRGYSHEFDPNAYLHAPIDTLLYNENALKNSEIEQVFNSQLLYTNQRIFKTNNYKLSN